MSTNTIPGNAKQSDANPNTYLDAKSSAIVSAAGQEGVSGWVFDVPTGESVDLETDITDHYIENGSFVNDHAVNKPVKITLSGLKGELIFEPVQSEAEEKFSSIANKLGIVNAYAPELSPQGAQGVAVAAQSAAYAASQFEAIRQRVSNLKKYFNGDDATETLQQKAFAELNAFRESKQIVTVQTPWAFYDKMMITTISARQNDKTNDYTEFTITLKEVRFADVRVTEFDANEYRSAIDVQSTPPTNNGPVQGRSRDSILFQGAQAVGAVNG